MENVKRTLMALLTIIVISIVFNKIDGIVNPVVVDESIKISESNAIPYEIEFMVIVILFGVYYLFSTFYLKKALTEKIRKLETDKLIENYHSFYFDKEKKKEYNIIKPENFRVVNLEADPVFKNALFIVGAVIVIFLIVKNLY